MVAAIGGALVAACATIPEAPAPGAAVAPTIVPIQVVGQSTFVSVRVDARLEDALFLLDTGASLTMLTPLFAKRLALVVPADARRKELTAFGGLKVSVPLITVSRLAVGTAVVENLTVGVYDAIPDSRVIDGILGLDFLKGFKLTLDVPGKVLRLEPNAAR